MRAHLATFWFWLRSSFWFVPVLMTVTATGLALGVIAVDRAAPWSARLPQWIYTAGPEGARSLLSALAGSMITVAGVVFSITMVALSLASSQFGPRLLINFMRDRSNQAVLGTFVATFMYCLMVLREIRAGDDEFVPHLAVTVALGLAATALIVLIYFIHHASTSIHVESVIAAVRRDLNAAVERFFGAGDLRDGDEDTAANGLPPGFEEEAAPVAALASGYVQAIDVEGILRLATDCDLIARLIHRPGRFVVAGNPVAQVWPAGRGESEVDRIIQNSMVIGAMRTPAQDVEFAINELVEVAVRALSPGVNDPFTAIACVDWLAESLCRIVLRARPPRVLRDTAGAVRVVLDPITFAGLVDAAFNQIRQHGHNSAAVLIRLLEALTLIARRARRADERAALLRHATMIERAARRLPEDLDRSGAAARYRELIATLDERVRDDDALASASTVAGAAGSH